MNKQIASLLIYMLFQLDSRSQSAHTMGLTALLNSGGQNLIWELSNDSIWSKFNESFLCDTSIYRSKEFENFILPERIKLQLNSLNLHTKICGEIPIQIIEINTLKAVKQGYYEAEIIATGTLLLPKESFENILTIRVIEYYWIAETTNQANAWEFKNTTNYFFAKEIDAPILCFVEKQKKELNCAATDYYYELRSVYRRND